MGTKQSTEQQSPKQQRPDVVNIYCWLEPSKMSLLLSLHPDATFVFFGANGGTNLGGRPNNTAYPAELLARLNDLAEKGRLLVHTSKLMRILVGVNEPRSKSWQVGKLFAKDLGLWFSCTNDFQLPLVETWIELVRKLPYNLAEHLQVMTKYKASYFADPAYLLQMLAGVIPSQITKVYGNKISYKKEGEFPCLAFKTDAQPCMYPEEKQLFIKSGVTIMKEIIAGTFQFPEEIAVHDNVTYPDGGKPNDLDDMLKLSTQGFCEFAPTTYSQEMTVIAEPLKAYLKLVKQMNVGKESVV